MALIAVDVQAGGNEQPRACDGQHGFPVEQAGSVQEEHADHGGHEDGHGAAAGERQQGDKNGEAQRDRLQPQLDVESGGGPGGRTPAGRVAAPLALQAAVDPPGQRPDADGQKLGEMIAVGEAPLDTRVGVSGMFVEPEVLPVARRDTAPIRRSPSPG